MPRWKKGETEFEVGVNFVKDRGYASSIPKPVIDKLGNPNVIKFVMKDEMIQLEAVKPKKNKK